MGRPKEFLRFGEDTFLSRTASTLSACADPVVVVRREPGQELPALPATVRVVDDERPGQGPLAAIATGLRRLREAGLAPEDRAFVTGCDTPQLTASVVRWLAGRLGDADLLVPRHEGYRQPLCAIYRLAVLDAIDDMLARGISRLRQLTEEVRTELIDSTRLREVDPDLRCLRNINTPESYDALRRRE